MLHFLLAPFLVLALPSAPVDATQPFRDESREGLVVLEAPAADSLADAGLLPGDVLLSWRRGDAAGLLRWPAGLAEVETEQAPRGAVTLFGRRSDQPMRWQMPPVRWKLRTRPALDPHLRALYREGARLFADRDPERGAESWRAAVDAAVRADNKPLQAWLLGELGRAWGEAGKWRESDTAYEEAVRRAEGTGLAPALLRDWAATFLRRQNWGRAADCYQRALALMPEKSLSASQDLAALASIATRRGDLATAERLYRQALSARTRITVLNPYLSRVIREEVAGFESGYSGSTREQIDELRDKLQRLKTTLLETAGLAPAADRAAPDAGAKTTPAAAKPPQKDELSPLEIVRRALVKAEQEGPGSLTAADRWQDLGELTFAAGDLTGAEIAWLRALDLREKLAPGTLREARTLHDLGRVHAQAGRDRAAASFLCRAAGALDRRNRPTADDREAREALGEEPRAYDRDCIAALVAARRPEEAFAALERSRVRGTLPLATDLAARRKELERDRAGALLRLEQLSTSRDRDEVDLLLAYTGDLESRRAEIARPPGLDNLRAALAPGTLLAAWSIGEEESFLFVAGPAGSPGAGLEVFPVRLFTRDLPRRIATFAAQAEEAKEAGTVPRLPRREATELYRLLLGPAEARIDAAARLVLLPGEMLARLPFGALVRGESTLEEQKAIETAASATAWLAAHQPATAPVVYAPPSDEAPRFTPSDGAEPAPGAGGRGTGRRPGPR